MTTKLSELVTEIEEFISQHGDVGLNAEYYCVDCRDTHTGHGVRLVLSTDNRAELEVIRLGEDDRL